MEHDQKGRQYDKGEPWMTTVAENLAIMRDSQGNRFGFGRWAELDNFYVTTHSSPSESCLAICERIGMEIHRLHPSNFYKEVRPNEAGAWGRALKTPIMSPWHGDSTQLNSVKYWRGIYNHLLTSDKCQLPNWVYNLGLHLTTPRVCRLGKNPAAEETKDW